MSSLLDFGAFYSKTGNIAQLDFANKCVDRGSTIIALKSNKGIVIAIEKPKHSCLIKNKENKRLFHMSNKIYTAYTGLLTDGKFISLLIKDQVINLVKLTKEISPNSVKRIFVDYLSYFTTTYNLRPIGCNFITAMNYEKKYYLSVSEFNSLTTFYKAYAVGKGAVRAKTELEKEDFSEMEVGQLADHAVRIMYGCHDPVQNNDFDIELCYMNESTNYEMMEVSESDLNILVEKYKHLNVD